MEIFSTILLGLSLAFIEAKPVVLVIFSVLSSIMDVLSCQRTPYFIIGLFATRKFKPAKNYHKYAILIPARNEKTVLPNLIESIKKQDYPQELLTVFVIADNCTDTTAQTARDMGAICYERTNTVECTKGFALKFLFENIERDYGITSFDGYFIFDADNLLKYDYISRMNDSFDAGEKIITSYRNTKNFNESWIASTYALHWLRSIRANHRARSVLRLATNIQGTGFLFASEIVKDGWKYTSLTEDRALTADCVVQGYEISYNDAAEFYDEQPNDLKIALRQRLRWSKGHLLAFCESGWGLFRDIFIPQRTKGEEGERWTKRFWRSLRHRFMAFDTFSQLVPKYVINIIRWILKDILFYPVIFYSTGLTKNLLANGTYIGRFLKWIDATWLVRLSPGFKTYILCIVIAIGARIFYRICSYFSSCWIAVYVFIAERKRIVKIPFYKKVLYCITWPIFDIIGRYTQYIALFAKVTWKPIPHNSKVTIDDISNNLTK